MKKKRNQARAKSFRKGEKQRKENIKRKDVTIGNGKPKKVWKPGISPK